jgi:excisionase family DNA binding protein
MAANGSPNRPTDTPDPPPALLTWRAVAHRLNVSPATIRKWSRQGRLRTIKLGKSTRFDSRDVEQLIAWGVLSPRRSIGDG